MTSVDRNLCPAVGITYDLEITLQRYALPIAVFTTPANFFQFFFSPSLAAPLPRLLQTLVKSVACQECH